MTNKQNHQRLELFLDRDLLHESVIVRGRRPDDSLESQMARAIEGAAGELFGGSPASDARLKTMADAAAEVARDYERDNRHDDRG